VAAEVLEHGLQQLAHAAVEGAAGCVVRGQQQQRTGIHQLSRFSAAEPDQMFIVAVGNAHGAVGRCIARYGVCVDFLKPAGSFSLWDQANQGSRQGMEPLKAVAAVKVGLLAAVLPGPVAQAVERMIEDGRERDLQRLGW
jgi:hypothetical protein